MNWFDELLPESCPPKDAVTPNGDSFYRLAKNNPPTSEDFFSQRQEFPTTIFPNIDECTVRAVSIWKTPEKCLEQKKFPRHKDKVVAVLVLNKDDGVVKQTFKPNHYSWWRSNDFTLKNVTIL